MAERNELPEKIICVEPGGSGEPFSIPYGSLKPKDAARIVQTPAQNPSQPPTSTPQPTGQPKK